jgi:hypothetical protein
MGCGRGGVMAMVPSSFLEGMWSASTCGLRTSPAIVPRHLRNMELEGVHDRCELKTGDMLAMPFSDAAFDLVVSGMAIHNIDENDVRNHIRRFQHSTRRCASSSPAVDSCWQISGTGPTRTTCDVRECSTSNRVPGMALLVPTRLGAGLVSATKPRA